jgi:hypothetical protein
VDVLMATSAGQPGRSNEDFVGAVPRAAVLLDGAGITGTESICHHGVAWYTHRLGGALLGRLSADDGRDLASILADAIDELARGHRHTCDVAHPSSPQATVALFRADHERAEYLVLADTHVLLGRTRDSPVVVTDEREVAVRHSCLTLLDGLKNGTEAHDAALATATDAMRARRNQPGGYWIAKDDPRAAEEAVTGAVPLADLTHVALLSNGATRIVDPYALATWSTLLDLCRTNGPSGAIRMLRRHEGNVTFSAGNSELKPDDASVALCISLQQPEQRAADRA